MSWDVFLLFFFSTFLISATPGPNMLLAFVYGLNFGVRRTLWTLAGLSLGLFLLLVAALLGLDVIYRQLPWLLDVIMVVGAVYLAYLGIQSWRHSAGNQNLLLDADSLKAEQVRLQSAQAAEVQVHPIQVLPTQVHPTQVHTAQPHHIQQDDAQFQAAQTSQATDTRGEHKPQLIQVQPWRLLATGVWVSLSNPKAILFFAAFFPKFLNFSAPMLPQYLWLTLGFFVSETTWQLVYTLGGQRLAGWLQTGQRLAWLNRLCGMVFVLIAVGLLWEVLA